MGLVSSPAAFIQMISRIFKDKTRWNFLFCYADDILLASSSFSDHVTHLRDVLHNLSVATFGCCVSVRPAVELACLAAFFRLSLALRRGPLSSFLKSSVSSFTAYIIFTFRVRVSFMVRVRVKAVMVEVIWLNLILGSVT